jgi:predicted Fe-S protein YdhL (DUF1289 family)
MTAIATPCIKVCTLDRSSGRCLGCGRTLSEIAHWTSMDELERLTIMRDLPARRASGRMTTAGA